MSSSLPASTKQLNPFYIDKVRAGQNGEDDDWADSFDDDNNNHEGWGDDDEDLEDLLEQEGQQPRRSKGGYLPVRNLTARQQQYDSDTRWRRNSYCCLILVAAIVAAYLHAKNRTSFPHDADNKGGPPIQRITILGERNSGLEWLEEKIKKCYPKNVTVSSTLFRKGYFFQDKPPKGQQQPKTIVLAVFLNPYDWVELMRLHPQFMPQHSNIASWKPFLTSPWTMDRPPSDSDTTPSKPHVCQQNFSYHQVVSCSPNTESNTATDVNNPIYELQRSGSGEPYSSILKLRLDKIRNFIQDVAKFDNVEKVVKIRYETLVDDAVDDKGRPTGIPGLWVALQEISQYSEYLDPLCDLKGPGKKQFFAPALGKHDAMTSEFVDFMNAQVDWDAEKLVGYQQWDANKIPLSPVDYYDKSDEIGPSRTYKDSDTTGGDTDDTATDDAISTTASPSTSAISPDAPTLTTKPSPKPLTTKPSPKPTSLATRKPSKRVTKAPSSKPTSSATKKPSNLATKAPTAPRTTSKPVTASSEPTKEPVAKMKPRTEKPSSTPTSPVAVPTSNSPTTNAPVQSAATTAPTSTPVITASPKKEENPTKSSDSPSKPPSNVKVDSSPSANPTNEDNTSTSAPSP